jgi:large subunit ribosomal protein L1
LPNLFGKEKRVIVFAKGSDADAATAAGAEVVGAEDLIDKIKGGWLEFDVAIATPDMMKEVGKLGPVLGRRGLMPSPKNGTVTNEVETAIKEFKKGKVEYRANKAGVVQVPVGKASLDGEKITQNFKAFFSEIMKAKPSNIKGEFLRSVHLSSTMGAGLKLNKKKID